jgi:hypothetical protein
MASLASFTATAVPVSAAPTEVSGYPTPEQMASRAPDAPVDVNTTNPLGTARTTLASTDNLGCPAGYACGWIDIWYANYRGQWGGNNPNWTVFPRTGCVTTGTWNDCVSSFDNNGSQCSVTVTRDAQYQGGGVVFFRGDRQGDLRNNWINDDITSNYWC